MGMHYVDAGLVPMERSMGISSPAAVSICARPCRPARSMTIAMTAVLAVLGLSTGAKADKTWPRFPSDGEIALAMERLHNECGGDRFFVPMGSLIKSRVTKRRDSTY